MNIKINFPKDDSHIYNLAFVKALLIKSTLDSLELGIYEKINIQSSILEYLKNN